MVDRKIAKLLHQPARPANRRSLRTFCLAHAEEYFFSMLGKKSRPGLKEPSLSHRFSFQRDRRADRIPITLTSTKLKRDGRFQLFHHILHNPQLGSIAVFQEYFKPSVMIEIRQGERPAILEKVQPHHTGNIGKRSIPIVRVEDIALEATPRAIGADEFVDGVPSLFVI